MQSIWSYCLTQGVIITILECGGHTQMLYSTYCMCMHEFMCIWEKSLHYRSPLRVPPTTSISWLWLVSNYADSNCNYNQLDHFQLAQCYFCMHAGRVVPFSHLPDQLTKCRLIQTSRVRLVSSSSDLDTPSYLISQLELIDLNPIFSIQIVFIV